MHRPGPNHGPVALVERIADLGTRSGPELPVQQSNRNLFSKSFVLFWFGFFFFFFFFFLLI